MQKNININNNNKQPTAKRLKQRAQQMSVKYKLKLSKKAETKQRPLASTSTQQKLMGNMVVTYWTQNKLGTTALNEENTGEAK